MKRNMKNYNKIIILSGLVLLLSACADFLNVVPEKTGSLDMLFDRRESAYKALATCYHFLPQWDGAFSNYGYASDELIAPIQQGYIPGRELMLGRQNATNPILGYWDNVYGIYTQESLYRGIRCCNELIDNIGEVFDMTDQEKASWKAEAIFLKAYYHFLLFAQYGPIPIVDNNLPIDAMPEEMRMKRRPVDEVVAYIVSAIDLAMKSLPERVVLKNDLGRVDQVIAAAIKSRVLLYAASPLFNGNAEYYDRFTNKDGEKLFNTTYDREKWKLAADASKQAIDLAVKNKVALYEYDYSQPVIPYDDGYMEFNEIQALYNYRYMFVDKWNKELIWGNSNPVSKNGSWWAIQASAMPMNPASSSNEAAWSWCVPTLDIVEAYYTAHGLPIDEDKTFDYERRFSNQRVGMADSLHAMFNELIPRLHQGREPRFYASIGFDRGIYRVWGEKWQLQMRFGEKNGRKTIGTKDYSPTGYLCKKVCHPQSDASTYSKLVAYPWPIIRMAELYLNYAEALNEYLGPGQEVYDALNVVRRRVKIPDVEDSWSNPDWAVTVNKHKEQAGLREIIRRERHIELAFEGWRNFDVRRWKEGEKYFNTPILGWTVEGETTTTYYRLRTIFQRSFITPRDYLHPVKLEELDINSNLVQSQGW
jgi:hypothetical protein